MVYNSTIGLEASILGVPVLCGGRAPFTQYPTVFFPETVENQLSCMRESLSSSSIAVPDEFKRNARRLLYFQLFRTSLPFGEFLVASVRTTQARLKEFGVEQLVRAPSFAVIRDGLLSDGQFLLPDVDPVNGVPS